MELKLTDDLITNVKLIDEQHETLLYRINALYKACFEKKGKDEVEKVIKFLEEYVVEHFTAEEKEMVKSCYSDYHKHKIEHDNFKKSFELMKEKLHDDKANATLILNKTLRNWFISHIKSEDKKLAEFLNR